MVTYFKAGHSSGCRLFNGQKIENIDACSIWNVEGYHQVLWVCSGCDVLKVTGAQTLQMEDSTGSTVDIQQPSKKWFQVLHKSNLLVSPDVIGFHEHQISPLVSHFVTNDGHSIADVERLSGDQVNQFDVSFLQNENDEMFIHGQPFNGVTRLTVTEGESRAWNCSFAKWSAGRASARRRLSLVVRSGRSKYHALGIGLVQGEWPW